MPNFDTTSPIGSKNRGEGAFVLRELKSALVYSLRGGFSDGLEAIFPGNNPTTDPIFRYRCKSGNSSSIPSSGNGGLYFDTDKNTLRRDNGISWDDISTNLPSGTKMGFYGTTAPAGWTAVAINDKFLRVVSSGLSGGATGGTMAASTSLSHTHVGNTHSHNLYWHDHDLGRDPTPISSGIPYPYLASSRSLGSDVGTTTLVGGSSSSWWISAATTDPSLINVTGSNGYTTGSSIAGAFAYSDIVIASKD